MTKTIFLASALLAIAAAASPASAVTNLIKNGSFEAGSIGTGGFVGWTKTNVPSSSPATVIPYNSPDTYPTGAFGEKVSNDDIVGSGSPDAVGNQAAYFVSDFSVDETISQLTYLGVGNYRVGFSYYLPQNGLANDGNASFSATIIGIPVAMTSITNASPGQTWHYATGVASISVAGYYRTSFVFNSNENPSKDIVIDRVFAISTTDSATVTIPPTPTFVPEPAAWAMLVTGFGLVGATMRRRKTVVAA